MTDQATARDRAIEAEQVAIGIVERLLFTEGCEESLRHARTVVRTMRHRPEVLRALAGAPTADVAAELKRYGDLPLDAAFLVYGEPEQLIFRGPTGQVVLRRVHAAAPEGVDAADEVARAEKTVHDLRLTLADAEQAQGEMADQLTAAQAAIQRVREVCAKRCGPHDRFAIAAVLRALDGDTTEEGR